LQLIVGKSAFHYVGSSTTPTCNTPVDWIVIGDTLKVEDNGADLTYGCYHFAKLFKRYPDKKRVKARRKFGSCLSSFRKRRDTLGAVPGCLDVVGNYRSPITKWDSTVVS